MGLRVSKRFFKLRQSVVRSFKHSFENKCWSWQTHSNAPSKLSFASMLFNFSSCMHSTQGNQFNQILFSFVMHTVLITSAYRRSSITSYIRIHMATSNFPRRLKSHGMLPCVVVICSSWSLLEKIHTNIFKYDTRRLTRLRLNDKRMRNLTDDKCSSDLFCPEKPFKFWR